MTLHTAVGATATDQRTGAQGARTSRLASPPPGPLPETEIRLHCERANFVAAAGMILQRYGHEVRAFLTRRTRNRVSMEEVFSVFSEDVWKGLPSFRFEGKVRSWVYAVARNALSRHVRSKQRWGKRHVVAELEELHEEVRRSMDSRLGDHARLAPALGALPAEDRALIEQRLVLSMQWHDIALERLGSEASEALLKRESARLRKRYELLVKRLRKQLSATRDSALP